MVSACSLSSFRTASEYSSRSRSKRMALKSASETVRNSGLISARRNSSRSWLRLIQKLSSSSRASAAAASLITTDSLGSAAVCTRSFPISRAAMSVRPLSLAFSILSSRRPTSRTGSGNCGLSSLPLGLSLKYSKLSQQSRIRNTSFSRHHGLALLVSSKRVPRPTICQNLV
ncbi:hypothetical protein D3C77_474380 [compost metagenome]